MPRTDVRTKVSITRRKSNSNSGRRYRQQQDPRFARESAAARARELADYRKGWGEAYKTYTDRESVLSLNIKRIQSNNPITRAHWKMGRTQRAKYFANVKQDKIKQAAPYVKASASVRVAKAKFLKQYPKR